MGFPCQCDKPAGKYTTTQLLRDVTQDWGRTARYCAILVAGSVPLLIWVLTHR